VPVGGLAIFMMADNKEQSVCMKFCFLLGSEQSLTENKTSRTLFFLYNQPPQKSPNLLAGTYKKATTTITLNLD
jgi:hypothetical protein